MEKQFYSLTNPQKAIYLTEEYYKGTNINHICGTMTIKVPVNFDKLTLAIKQFVKQNDGCRIMLDKQENKQYIAPYQDFSIEMIDVHSNLEVNQLANEIVSKTFTLYNSYLFSFVLYRFPDGHGGFVINMHHLISDSWTLGILVNEIISIYSSYLKGESFVPKEIETYSYLNYISSEEEYKKSEKYKKDQAYWNDLFQTIPDNATIPSSIVDRVEPQSIKAQREQLSISASLLNKIKEFCVSHKVSLFNFLMAIYSIYIGRVSNLKEFCLGTPILNRSNYKEKNTVGMFINILPLFVHLDSQLSFPEFLSTISSNSMSLLRHQKYAYQSILEDLRKREKSLPGLYKIMISYQITKMNEEQDILPHESNWLFNQTMSDDIDIHIFDLNDTNELNIAYDYKVNSYTAKDMRQIHARIESIIHQILEKESLLLSEIEIVTSEEKQQLLYDFNRTNYTYPKDKTLAELFEEQVSLTPDQTALVFEGNSLTYQELNEKANQLALFLRQNGIKNNSIVGILINRSLEMMIAILAVLKSGGAYIPIDPDYPTDRIHYVLENSNCSIVLTKKELFSKVTIPCKIVDINLSSIEIYTLPNANLPSISQPEDLSYLIYTSGSTGKPKGVMLTQKALTNLTFYCNDTIPYLKNREPKSIVSVTTVSFDIFIFETLISLQRGLRLVIANHNEQTIPHCLDELIEKENIEIIQTTPSRMQLFYNQREDMPHLSNLKDITLAGEPLPITLKNNLVALTHGRVYNGYGPSETTVFSTLTEVTNHKQITIGKALYNTQIYILDNYLNPCPIGIAGEIYIAGDGVGHGYMGNTELTQKSFISNPFIPDTIMYQTGDVGVYLENGEILCLGRVDHQVKIRGLRIELGEIEKQMMQFSGISNACVVKKVSDEGHEFLCAYYTSNNPIVLNDLRQSLKKSLPNYMIPQYFIPLDYFPYTPNGKIDKKALPELDSSILFEKKNSLPARNEIDHKLLALLSNLLKIKQISIDDSFYDLGGDSLSAIQLCSILYHQMQVQISVKDILAHPIMMELSDFIAKELQHTAYEKIKPVEKREFYPTSSAQKRIYYASEMKPGSIVYNIAGGLLLDKIPDIAKLETCFQTLVQRHATLRTYFSMMDGNLVQKVVEKIDFELKVEDGIYDDIETIVSNFVKPFNLHDFPLFRAKLVLFENEKALLLIDMHHSISDGSSLTILLEELCSLYNQKILPENYIDYPDFAVWENSYLSSPAYVKDKQYWLEQFASNPPILEMPCSLPRPEVSSYIGDTISCHLENELSKSILEMAKKQNITPYMFLLTAYFILLYKYTSQEDLVVGTPIMNRENPELEHVLGMFVNNLALRSSINSSISIKQYFDEIKTLCLNSFKHQTYPFDELVKELKLKREANRNPIFDTMFIYQNNGYPSVKLGDISATYYIPDNHIAKFDFSLEVIPHEEDFTLNFEYDTNLFTKEYMENMILHYQNILKTFITNVDLPISKVNMLTSEEELKIKTQWNNTYFPYNKSTTVLDLWEEQVEKSPNEIAVIFEKTSYTYQEINRKANQLAHCLVETYHIKRNQVVGVLLNRSIETIISMIAILKSGAAYLLIDSSLPFDRIIYMLENANSPLLITDSQMKKIDFPHLLFLDKILLENYSKNNLGLYISNEDLLSIVYTSGSTGLPKGVMVKKLGMANLILSYRKHIGIENYSTFLSICSLSFDMFGVEVWIPLSSGKKIILANEEQCKIPAYISQLIIDYQVEYMLITPSKLQLLLDSSPDCLRLLKSIQLGGEALNPAFYQKLSNVTDAIICNEYGPSECTSCSTYQVITDGNSITIGKPFCNTQVYICDQDLNLRPVGFEGEICIAGDGVSDGYVNNNVLTDKVFIPNPFGEGKLYKTGDIGRLTENGEIYYIGRKDFQVKIHGLRIELPEIEHQIAILPHITNVSVVCITEEGGSSLAAYFTADKTLDVQEMRSKISKKLPSYMIPKYLIQKDSLPLSANGKVDKRALESLKIIKSQIQIEKVLPETPLQQLYCDIWSQLLKTPIGIDDNIFELGADSLLAIKFKTELLAHDINIPYADLFQYPTIRKLSEKHKVSSDESNKVEINHLQIQAVLEKNQLTTLKQKISYQKENNVLLLGGNGFVGVHVLYELIKHDTGNIYCVIRNKKEETAYHRFQKILHFYFGNELDNMIGERIHIIAGSVLEENFSLSEEDFENLMQNVSTIINAAAIVKHYGNEKDFKAMNVELTQKLIKLCEQYDKRLLHISTTSVAGKMENSNNIIFSESDLDIGQDLENLYVKTKFEAEHLILQGISNGLHAQILRLGNIMSRYCDGKFQMNPRQNSFVNRLQSFVKLQMVPENLKNSSLEFTPVDSCAQAIVSVLQHELQDISIFHIYNHYTITMEQFIDFLRELHFPIDFVPLDIFDKKIKETLASSEEKNVLFGIINDLTKEEELNYSTFISTSSVLTQSFLSQADFAWPKIDENYIKQYIQYLKNIKII